MKINKFLAIALAAGVFASCASNDDNNNAVAPGTETYAAFSVSLPQSTRAEDSAAGEAFENNIVSVGVYIYDVDHGTFHYDVRNIADFNKTGDTYSADFAVKTTTGKKQVFVVANPLQADINSALITKKGATLNNTAFGLTKDKYYDSTNATVANRGMVLSGKYYDAVGTTDVYDLNVVRSENEAKASAAQLSLDLYRNLAKVVVQKGTGYTVIGGTTTLQYTLVSEANDATFLVPDGSAVNPSTLYSAVHPDAIDPVTGPTHAYWNNFSATTSTSNTYNAILENAVIAKNAAGFYAFEHKPASFYTGNTTSIRLKGVFEPTAIVKAYASGLRTPGVAADLATNAQSVPAKTFSVLSADRTYWHPDAVAAAISEGAYTAADFDQYSGGVGYYTVPVQDENNVMGVERNKLYVIQINEVNGPGSSKENPVVITPIQKESYLSISATVHHWDVQSSAHDIQ